jgi:RNA polymerase sigma factor (sigma-70 family)
MFQSAVVGFRRNCGLIRAIELYDFSRGCNWTTVATPWIDSAIKQVLSDRIRYAPQEPSEIEAPDSGPSPEAHAASAEERRLLAAALTELPEAERAPLEAILGGATFAEVGQAAGKQRETIRERALRGASTLTNRFNR